MDEAIVMSDKQSGRSRGFGFVTFKEESSAKKAVAEMNGKNVDGREIKVTEATPLEKKETDSKEKEVVEKTE